MKRAHRTVQSRLYPEDVIAMDRVLMELLENGDEDWNREVEEAWEHFFAERQRVLIPLITEAII